MKPIRLGVIGCGGMSRHHARVFLQNIPQAEIVALCDPNPANLATYLNEFPADKPKPPTYADYREMLRTVRCDGVLIVTPHTQHFEQAMAALDAGAHVLLEKPMVIEADHARRLIEHADKKKRVLSLAFPGPFCAEFQYVCGLRDRGEWGEVMQVDAMVSQNWQQLTTGTWRQDPKLSGGGQAFDTGAHMFNALLYLTGLRPVEVFAWSDYRGTPVDINTVATIKFHNGALASAFVGGADVSGWQSGIFLSATKRSLRIGTHSGPVEVWDEQGQKITPALPAVTSLQQNFVDGILGEAQTLCPPIWGLRQALLMEAIYRSLRTGQPTTVQPE